MKMTEIINQKCCKNVEVFRNMIQGLVDRVSIKSSNTVNYDSNRINCCLFMYL